MAVQDDGQIVIGGSFTSVNGVAVTNLAHIDIHGNVDAAWAPNPDGSVGALVTSGTNVFVAGFFNNIGGQVRGGLALLSTTGFGQADPNWYPHANTYGIYTMVLSGDSLYVGGSFDVIGGVSVTNLARLSITGTGAADPTWIPTPNAVVYSLVLSGKDLYVGGAFTTIYGVTRNRLAEVSISNPGLTGWNPNVDAGLPNPDANSRAFNLVLSGTNIFVSGLFTNVGGFARASLAKVSAFGAGAVDTAWNPNANPGNYDFALAANTNNLFVGGSFTSLGGQNTTNLAKLSMTGTGGADTNWTPTVNGAVNVLMTSGTWLFAGGSFSLVDDSLLALGLTKVDQGTGIFDTAFYSQVGVQGVVKALVRQADGKVIVGGDFWLAGETMRPHLARVNTDGTLDATWEPGTDGIVSALAINGTNLYVGGAFTYAGGLPRNGLAKVDISATDLVDPTWNPPIGASPTVNALATDTNYLYVGGDNLGMDGMSSNSFARVSLTGMGLADPNWIVAVNGPVFTILINQNNAYVGGQFSTIQGQNWTGVARFFTGGSGVVDTNWNANVGGVVNALAASNGNGLLAMAGGIFLGGSFTSVGGQARYGLAEVSFGNGGVASGWNSPYQFPEESFRVLAVNGANVYVGGSFGFGSLPQNLARLSTTTGAVDTNWAPNPDRPVFAIVPTSHSAYIGGSFQNIGGAASDSPSDGTPRNGFAFWATADAPVMVRTTPTSFVIDPNPINGPEITYFQITAINGISLFLSDGVTPVHAGDFITVAQGAAGLVFTGANGTVSVVSSVNNMTNGTGTAATTINLGTFQAPVFTFSSPNYSVTKNGGPVIVSVQKQGAGAASVSYTTTDGTAVSTGPSVTVVVPNANAGVDGNQANNYPFNITTSGASNLRYQQVYANSQFGAVPSGGSWITAVSFRPGGLAFSNATLASIQIDLSTTPNGPDALNPIFANNDGADDKVVFNGPLTLSSGATGSPRAFDIVIPLTTPFFYNPAAGNLLMDVRNADGGITSSMEEVSATNDSVSRLYNSVGPAMGQSDSGGLVTQFSFTPAAPPLADYTNASGTLNFGGSDTSMNIVIGIIAGTVYEGDRTFSVNLSNPTGGAVIGYPGTAAVTIVENSPIAPVNSLTTNVIPAALPPATGSIMVTFAPAISNALWRLAGQTTWHSGGVALNNLVTGNYVIEFMPANGYQQPDTLVAHVISGFMTQPVVSYAVGQGIANGGTGYVTEQIFPSSVATNADISQRGQWRIVGTSNWFNSGDTISNQPSGVTYTIEFKGIPNWAAPPSVSLVTVDHEGVRSRDADSTYITATGGGGEAPGAVGFGTATTQQPYMYAGQIQTDSGSGSGVVVKDRVVLTAAHLLFNSETFSYATGVKWFYQRSAGNFEPVPQTPRGWYIPSGYAAQRQADLDPNVQSAASLNLDVGAMYFLESAGRGGSGGYLISDTNTAWLATTRNKLLMGYPMEGVPTTNQGQLMATAPLNATFTQAYSNVYSTMNFSGYAGMDGGPLEVLADDGNYYPAGVYLGPAGNTNSLLVRELDASAANLINFANLSATERLYIPLPTPGVPGLLVLYTTNAVQPTLGLPSGLTPSSYFYYYVQVNTGPSAAFNAGARWRVPESSLTTWYTAAPNNVAPIIGQGKITIEFDCIQNGSFAVPYQDPNLAITLVSGQTAILDIPYLPPPTAPATLGITTGQSGATLFFKGQPHYSYEIDYTSNLINGPWLPLPTTEPLPTGLPQVGRITFYDNTPSPYPIPDPLGNSATRFYRAKWLTGPCPVQ